MIIDWLVADTFASISGIKALLDHADRSMPEMEWQEQENLKKLAESEGWDYHDYDAERQGLEADYRHWVPKYSAYSAVIILCSIAETRLVACAERVGTDCKSTFVLKELKGSPLEAAARYLKRVAGVDVATDAAWKYLRDMQTLRNLIVHRGGLRGSDLNHQREFDGLLARHEHRLFRSKNLPFGEEIWVSMEFCRVSAAELQSFFMRLFRSLGFPDSRLWQ